jgi:hypothetical protein
MVADLFWLLAALNCVNVLRRGGDSVVERASAGAIIFLSGALFIAVTWANRPIPCGG